MHRGCTAQSHPRGVCGTGLNISLPYRGRSPRDLSSQATSAHRLVPTPCRRADRPDYGQSGQSHDALVAGATQARAESAYSFAGIVGAKPVLRDAFHHSSCMAIVACLAEDHRDPLQSSPLRFRMLNVAYARSLLRSLCCVGEAWLGGSRIAWKAARKTAIAAIRVAFTRREIHIRS